MVLVERNIVGTPVDVRVKSVANNRLDFRTQLFDWIQELRLTDEQLEAELNMVYWFGSRGAGRSEFRGLVFELAKDFHFTEEEVNNEVGLILHNRTKIRRP